MPPTTLFQRAQSSIKPSARQLAVNEAKSGRDQTVEVFRDVQKQIVGGEQQPKSPETKPNEPQIVSTIKDLGPENIDREKIAADERALMSSLEAELKRLRAAREQSVAQHKQIVSEELSKQNQKPVASEAPPVQGKIRKAFGSAAQKIKSVMGSRKQQESKAGTGKG